MTGWEIRVAFSFSATGSLSDVGKSIKVNVLYVVLKGGPHPPFPHPPRT